MSCLFKGGEHLYTILANSYKMKAFSFTNYHPFITGAMPINKLATNLTNENPFLT